MKKAYLFALALLVSCAQIEAQEYAVEDLLSSTMNEDALNILTAGVYVVKRYWSNGNIEVNKIVKQ